MTQPDISDLPAPPSSGADISDLPAPKRVGWVEENIAGPSELIGNAIANIPHAAAHAAVDLYRRVTGGDTSAPDPSAVQTLEPTQYLPSAGGQQLAGDIKSMLSPPEDPNSIDSQIQAIRAKALGPQNATVGDVLHQTGQVAGDVAALAPVVGGVVKGASALTDVLTPEEATAITSTAQAAANKAAASANAGAAGAAVDVSKLTPETQAKLARVESSGGTVNPTALARTAEAESLPVPVRLTAGQARGDADMVSKEFNMKGEDNNAIGSRYDEQDQALKDSLAQLHRDAAPDTVANDPIQNGQVLVDSLKRYDQPKVAAINAAYNDANAANVAAGKGGLTLDPAPAVSHATQVLEDRADLLPTEGKSILAKLQEAQDSGESIPLKQAETWRTTVARASRKYDQAGDTNAVRALSDFRDSLEQMTPNNAATDTVAAKYTAARNLAKTRFAELDADPAYKAAVDDETPIGEQSDLADKFTDKYVLNGSKAALQRLRPKLDAEGSHAMTSSAMNFLQRKAGINPDTGAGKFSNTGYNTGLTKIMPKAPELLGDTDLIDGVRRVGNVANYTQNLSRGSYANTSHTFIAEKAAEIGEHAVNVAAHGLPIGTIVRRFLASRSKITAARDALEPGAGLED